MPLDELWLSSDNYELPLNENVDSEYIEAILQEKLPRYLLKEDSATNSAFKKQSFRYCRKKLFWTNFCAA